MAYFFGAGMATDAFVTAFRVPNLLRDMFAEGALSSAFVPVFKEKLVTESPEEAFSLANKVLTAMILVVGVIVILGIIASPAIIYLTAHGFTDDMAKFDLTVDLTRIMFPFLLIVSVSALVMGMLNSCEKFGIPAFSPTVFNLGNVAVVVSLYWFMDNPIYALAIGVMIGGVGQLVVQLPQLFRLGYRFKWQLNFLDPGVKRVLALFTPMVIGLSAGRVNILVSTLLASFLADGAISYLNYSFRLMHFPLGVFAVALGTVSLPKISELATRKDIDGVQSTFLEAWNLNLFLVVPSAFYLAIIGPLLIDLIYQHGRFTPADSAKTALALLHYSYGLVGFAVVRIIAPVYYALGDSKLPMKISILSVVVNIAIYYPLIKLMDFAGLAAATSIAGLLNAGLLLWFMPSKGVPLPWRKIGISLLKVTAASAIALCAAKYFPVDLTGQHPGIWGRLLNLLLLSAISVIVYLLVCYILRVRELSRLASMVRRRRPAAS